MQSARPNLLTRDDTFLGVCEGLGEDLGIHSNYLRLAFAGLLFWNPVAAVGGYFAVGLIVALTRLLFPVPAPAVASDQPHELAPGPTATAEEPAEQEPMPLAA